MTPEFVHTSTTVAGVDLALKVGTRLHVVRGSGRVSWAVCVSFDLTVQSLKKGIALIRSCVSEITMDIDVMLVTIGAAHALEHIAAWGIGHAERSGVGLGPLP